MIIGCVLTSAAMFASMPAAAEIYETPEQFVAGAFAGTAPDARALWINPDLRGQLTNLLGRNPGLRIRYWSADRRSAWVLEEIGKDLPITAGIVVNDGAIEDIRVLAFRESRGWEIKYPFFTRQFVDVRLNDGELTRTIDGITGATLSVRAMKRMARVALLLHEHTPAATTALAKAR